MIKICYVIGQLGIGGAERQLFELVKGINKKKFYPIVVSLLPGGYWKKEIKKLGITVVELERRRNVDYTRLIKLIKIIKEYQPQIIHSYDFSSNAYGRIAALFYKPSVLLVASERNVVDITEFKPKTHMFVDKILATFTNAIICNSGSAAKTLVSKFKFNKDKVFVIHNGIDLNNFKNILKTHSRNKEEIIIGTVGRLVEQKKYKLLLKVAKVVLQSSNVASFRIVGDGYQKSELLNYAKELGIKDRISFLGESKDISKVLSNFDIFLMTSEYEGLSNAIMEAMAAGVPIVATDVGGNSELIVNNETGYLCRFNDITCLANKVIKLISNEKLAQMFSEKAKKRIINHFNLKKMVLETEKLYLNLLIKTN